jgi:hypothetical protein
MKCLLLLLEVQARQCLLPLVRYLPDEEPLGTKAETVLKRAKRAKRVFIIVRYLFVVWKERCLSNYARDREDVLRKNVGKQATSCFGGSWFSRTHSSLSHPSEKSNDIRSWRVEIRKDSSQIQRMHHIFRESRILV